MMRYILGQERQRVEVLDQPLAGPVPVAGRLLHGALDELDERRVDGVDRGLGDVAVQRPLVAERPVAG